MTPDTIVVVVAILGVGIALGGLILTSQNRMHKRIDALEAGTKGEIQESEARTKAEIVASESRTNARFEEVNAQFREINAQFREVNEQFGAQQARTDRGFDGMAEELRLTNTRMASIEQRQARLEGLLDGLREALFQRVQQ